MQLNFEARLAELLLPGLNADFLELVATRAVAELVRFLQFVNG